MALLRPRAILFDWDKTLVDNWAAIHLALNATLRAMGQAEWSYEDTLLRVRRSMRETFPEMFGDRWPEARDVFYAAFRARHLETLKPIAGAEAVLANLAGAGVPLGVVSNKSGGLLRKEAAALGWTGYFKRLVGAGDAAADKPSPDPVYLALGTIGVAAAPDVWFVGDAAIDLDCARRAGCAALLVGPGAGEDDEITRLAPEARLGGIGALWGLAVGAGVPISVDG